MRTRVVLPDPFGPSSPTIVPRSTSNDTRSMTRRAPRRPPSYENETSVALSILHRHVQGPTARALDVALAREANRRCKQRRSGDDRVILAALAAWIDAEPLEFRQQLGSQRTTEPRFIEKFAARRDDRRLSAGRNPFVKERLRRLAE